MDPSSVEIRHKLAETYFKQKKTDKAKSEFLEVLILDPHSLTSYNYLGLIAEHEEDYDLGIDYYTKGIALDRTFSPFYYNRGRAYTSIGNKEAACKDLNVALERGFEDAIIWLGANNCDDIKGLSKADKEFDKQERFNEKRSEISKVNITSNYLPMLNHSRYIFRSDKNGNIDTAAIVIRHDYQTTNDYSLLWNLHEPNMNSLFFELLHTDNFRSTKDSLKLLLHSDSSGFVPIHLFPREFTVGKEIIIDNSWNTKATYEMISAAISLEGIEAFEMPNGETKECLKLRVEIRGENGKNELSYIWLVKDFGIVKWRNSTGQVWEIIRYAVKEYGSFPEEEHIYLLPPTEEIIDDVIREDGR